MKTYFLCLVVLMGFLFSCDSKNKTGNNSLNPHQLSSQTFSINIDHDTILVTKNGCIINIPKGSLQSDSNNIKLEIKEALNMSDMIMAGLTTMSGKQSLSSGGMIYINAADGYNVNIKKKLTILVPTNNYNPDMKVYKGEQDENEKIDWTKPTSLPKDETNTKIDQGEVLFKTNCANCHKINGDMTGPTLYGITERRSKKWLYDFTRNPRGNVMATDFASSNTAPYYKFLDTTSGFLIPDFYRNCLFSKWKPIVMTSFPALNDTSLDALYAYIKTESDKHPELGEKYGKTCCDSCDAHNRTVYERSLKVDSIRSSQEFYNLDRTVNISPIRNIITPDSAYAKFKSTYYTLDIEEFGWYNLDYLMKDFSNCNPAVLSVHVNSPQETAVKAYLIIPAMKVFVQGDNSTGSNQFSFDEDAGKTALPENALCYIIAYGEYNGKILFGKTAFLSKQDQTIETTLMETTEASMKSQINVMNLNDLKFDLKRVQVPDTLIPTPDTFKISEPGEKKDTPNQLKPNQCDCEDYMPPVAYNVH